jgi:hypothetical protein
MWSLFANAILATFTIDMDLEEANYFLLCHWPRRKKYLKDG